MLNIEQKVKKAIELDKRMKEDKKELDVLKAELQVEALQEMENKNLKYVEYYVDGGSCAVVYKEKFELDNYPELRRVAGEVVIGKVKMEETVKFTVDDKFKKALTVLYNGEFRQHDIENILRDLYLDDKQIKVALKKLKGDYFKDKALLESLGVKSDLEEELDAIREQKNYELVEKFFKLDEIDIERLKKSISVEETLSIGLNYES